MSADQFMDRDSKREWRFAIGVVVGIGVFATGMAFLILGLAINTQPPAPYMSPWHRRVLIALSIVLLVVGAAVVRLSGQIIGR